MLNTNYNYSQNQNILSTMTQAAISFVEFHAFDAPILNQWHQLISAIREKANTRQWVTLINPPFIPNDAYLSKIGLGDHYVRVVRLKDDDSETTKYIQRCLQNGKSSVVAVWASQQHTLPDILLNDSPLGCQALVFTGSNESLHASPQLEMAV
jgi:cell division inhibitor SulA